jgi:hypothetical protein
VADVLVDAGPLVAVFDQSDHHHASCVDRLRSLRPPLLTVWPVLTEAVYLLGFSLIAQQAVLQMVDAGTVKLLALDESDVSRIRELMMKYRDVPMDMADAALVRVAERERLTRIFTLDRGFAIYRPAKTGRFEIIR